MYLSLFNSVTDAIELLKAAQVKCENTYIETDNDLPALTLVSREKKNGITQNPEKRN